MRQLWRTNARGLVRGSQTNIAQQTNTGSQTNIGQQVNYLYQHARPQPVDAEALTRAAAVLAALPTETTDPIPTPAALPLGSAQPPYPPYALFVGREVEFRQLAHTLKAGGTAAIGPIAAATGAGGIGKTQLAAEFAHRYGRFFLGGVFWLNCADAADVLSQVARCGGAAGLQLRPDFDNLKLDQQAGLVLAEWQNGLPRLLIFDNCESAELLTSLRPRTGDCRVLVTSRNAVWEAALGVQALPLDVLPRPQSVALLRRFRPDLAGPLEAKALDALAEELGDLPLALHLAGSYLERYQHEVTPAQLLAELRDAELLRHPALTGEGQGYSPTGHDRHVARTFAVSYNRLQGNGTVDALARQALARAACFAPGQAIPRALLKQTLGEVEPARLAEDALLRLAELGLLTPGADGAVTLHRLLARFVQQTAPDAGAFDAVAETLGDEASRINRAGLPAPLRAWVGHLRHAAETADSTSSSRAGQLFNSLGYHLQMEADYAGARAAYERALRIDEAAFGPDHPEVAIRVNNLGSVLDSMGDYAGARAAYARALRIDEAAFGPDHPNVARDVNNLGGVLKALGDYAGARAAYERALTIDEAAFGPDHPEVATDVNNLGSVLDSMGDYAGARAAYDRALTIDEAAFGPDHPEVATDVNNLGSVLDSMGDYAGARAAYDRALTIFEKALGPEHPNTRTVRRNLARVGKQP